MAFDITVPDHRSGAMSKKGISFRFWSKGTTPQKRSGSSTRLSCYRHVRDHDRPPSVLNDGGRLSSSTLRKQMCAHSGAAGSVVDPQAWENLHVPFVEA